MIGAFFVATIRPGMDWGDDYALYIQQATDIAHRVSYMQSNYIFNSQNPAVGPRAFPPVYPLLLSPIYVAFGLNLTAMKVENIALFLAFLFVFYQLIRDELPFAYAAAGIAIVGLNPAEWVLKDGIQSEVAFFFFLYSCLLFIKRTYESNSRKLTIRKAVFLGFLIYLCYGTRTIGIMLIPALLLYELVHFRTLTRYTVAAIVVFSSLYVVQHALGSTDGGYADMLKRIWIQPHAIIGSVLDYTRALSAFWAREADKPLRLALFFCVSSLAAIGYFRRLWNQATVWEFYLPLHLVISVLWPYPGGLRYLLPIIPLYVTYSLMGFYHLAASWSWRREAFAGACLLCVIAIAYVHSYATTDFGPFREGISTKEAADFFRYVSNETDRDAIFIFRKPKALGLFGRRRAAVYPLDGTDSQNWHYIMSIHAAYLVDAPIDDSSWHSFIKGNRSKLTQTYSNSQFTVFRVPSEQFLNQ